MYFKISKFKKLITILFIFNLHLLIFSKEKLKTGVVIENVKSLVTTGQSYSIYLPKNYDENKKWPVIIAFDPAARGSLPVKLFKNSCEKYGFIIVGSNNSKNYDQFAINTSAKTLLYEIPKRFSIDEKRIYLTGFSGGAKVVLSLAIALKNINGVIACGSGYHPDYKPSNNDKYLYIGVIGNLDSNYTELISIEKDMERLQIENKLIIFKGIHSWPDAISIEKAFIKIKLFEMEKKIIKLDNNFINKEFQKQLNSIVNIRKKGNIINLYYAYKNIIKDFAKFKNLQSLKSEFTKLKSTKNFKKILNNYENQLENEIASRNKYMKKSWIIETNKYDISKQKNDLAYFKREVKLLNKIIKKSNNTFEVESKTRLLSFIKGYFFESAYVRHLNKDYKKAIFFYKIALIASPENNFLQYNLACSFAKANKKDEALKYLEKALKNGFKNKKSILNDPDFSILKKDKSFLKLVN